LASGEEHRLGEDHEQEAGAEGEALDEQPHAQRLDPGSKEHREKGPRSDEPAGEQCQEERARDGQLRDTSTTERRRVLQAMVDMSVSERAAAVNADMPSITRSAARYCCGAAEVGLGVLSILLLCRTPPTHR
jgi:hypothetical protein